MQQIGVINLDLVNVKEGTAEFTFQQLFSQAVENNKVTTLYLNDTSHDCGAETQNHLKFIQLLKAYVVQLKKFRYDVKVVPVTMDYDRLFELEYKIED